MDFKVIFLKGDQSLALHFAEFFRQRGTVNIEIVGKLLPVKGDVEISASLF